VVFPHPLRQGPLELRLDMEGPADAVELRLYSSAYSLVLADAKGPWPSGWGSQRWQLPPGLARGAYFAVLTARRGDAQSAPVRKALYVLGP
jgi:hypothetical protein